MCALKIEISKRKKAEQKQSLKKFVSSWFMRSLILLLFRHQRPHWIEYVARQVASETCKSARKSRGHEFQDLFLLLAWTAWCKKEKRRWELWNQKDLNVLQVCTLWKWLSWHHVGRLWTLTGSRYVTSRLWATALTVRFFAHYWLQCWTPRAQGTDQWKILGQHRVWKCCEAERGRHGESGFYCSKGTISDKRIISFRGSSVQDGRRSTANVP